MMTHQSVIQNKSRFLAHFYGIAINNIGLKVAHGGQSLGILHSTYTDLPSIEHSISVSTQISNFEA